MDIEARIAAAHADRKARGLLVRWIRNGRECSESCANEEQKAALLADLARRGGRTIIE